MHKINLFRVNKFKNLIGKVVLFRFMAIIKCIFLQKHISNIFIMATVQTFSN